MLLDGSFQIAGFSGENANTDATTTVFSASLDSSGSVTGTPVTFSPTGQFGPGGGDGGVHHVSLQTDGKILVTGDISGGDGFFHGVIARYVANGTLDAVFTRPSAPNDQSGGFQKGVQESAGNIVALGLQGDLTVPTLSGALFRLNSSLTADTGFGDGHGMAKLAIPSGFVTVESEGGLLRDASGTYLVVSVASKDFTPDSSDGPLGRPLTSQIVVEKLTATGAMSPGFGSGGVVMPPLSQTNASGTTKDNSVRERAYTIAVDTSGLIYIGTSKEVFHDFGGTTGIQKEQVPQVTRLSSTGVVDTNFGTNGTVTFPENFSLGGDIVSVLPTADGVFVHTNRTIVRLDPATGAIDNSFDSNSEIVDSINGRNSVWAGFQQLDASNALLLGGVFGNCLAIGKCGNQNASDAASPDHAVVTKVRLVTDTTPDIFTFADKNNVTPATLQDFGPVTVTGINAPASVTVGGGGSPQVSIGCTGSFSTSGSINNNQTLCVRHTSSSNPSDPVTSTVTVGTYNTTFKSTTGAADVTPDNYVDFTAQSGATPNSLATSNTQTINGINAAATVSVTSDSDAKVSINGGALVSSGTITNGQTILVKMTSANVPQTARTANVTIGTLTRKFVVTTGDAALISLSPTSLSFASQPTGTTSAAKSVTLTNSGNAALTISLIAPAGDYAQTNNCPSSLAPSSSCTISVTFAPAATGTRSGSITITSNAAGSPNTVPLTGTGTGPAPVVSVAPPSLSFPNQNVGTTSAGKTVTLTNTGTVVLTIASIAASGNFAQTNTCPASLAAAANCTITVTFSPTVAGARSGAITISSNASTSPDSVPLSGTGVGPAVTLSPTGLDFGSQNTGTTSAVHTITLTNSGTAALSITASAASGDFAQTNNCPASLSAGLSCTYSVTFSPTATGARSGALTITSNAPGSPHTVLLSGNGTTPAAISLSPTSLTFGSQNIGTASAAQSVTLTNTGSSTLSIASVAVSGDFARSTTCLASLAGGANCTISVNFAPTAAGSRTGAVTITSNAAGSPHTIPLSGTGVTPLVGLTPHNIDFGAQGVGTSSAAHPVTLTNNGSSALAIGSIAASGDFSQANNCPASLGASASCTINVTFSPSTPGMHTGAITVTSSAASSPDTVALSGTGTTPAAVSLSPPSLSFEHQNVGTTSAPQTVTLMNTGTLALTISSIVVSGEFAQTNNCPASLAGGISCAINVTFAPITADALTGSLTITSNAGTSPNVVGLTGSSTRSVTVLGASGQPVTFTVDQGVLANLVLVAAPPDAPAGLDYPQGFFDYEITGVAPGSAVTLTVQLPTDTNPTDWIDCLSRSCYRYDAKVIVGDVIVVTLSDDGFGDRDSTSGRISGTVAPAKVGASKGGGGLGWSLLVPLIGAAFARWRRDQTGAPLTSARAGGFGL